MFPLQNLARKGLSMTLGIEFTEEDTEVESHGLAVWGVLCEIHVYLVLF